MDSAIIAALAAVGGSLVGAMGSFISGSITQRFHDRRNLLSAQLMRSEALYSDFISESAAASSMHSSTTKSIPRNWFRSMP